MFTECFNNSTCFTIFTMFLNVSQNILSKCSVKYCTVYTDFPEMAALQKFLLAAAMLPERISTATMLTAASRSQS